jgi:hypothetical protein
MKVRQHRGQDVTARWIQNVVAGPGEPPGENDDSAELAYAPTRPNPDSISAADTEKTEALILCVRELMQFHRAAILQAMRTGSNGRPSELDC